MTALCARPFVVVSASCLMLAGCSTGAPSTDEGDPAGMLATASSARADTAGDTSDAVDACALVPKEEIAALIGVTVDGVPRGQGAMTSCLWENPETYESVAIDIGAPGSAPNDALPPIGEGADMGDTPGPDGTRILGGGVEFAAGNRYNMVQVVSGSSDEDVAAAVELIDKIKPRISG